MQGFGVCGGIFQNTKKRQPTTWKRDVEVCSEETLAMGEVVYTPLGMTRRECDGRFGAMGVYKGRGMGGLEGMPASPSHSFSYSSFARSFVH